MPDKMKATKNNRKSDGNFKKKNIKHNPQAESTRAVFNAPTEEDLKFGKEQF